MNSETKTALDRLEMEIYQQWKGQFPEKVLLAVSGGLDSCVLLEVFSHLRGRLNTEVVLAHVHHGPSDNPLQVEYRDRCQEFLKKRAEENSLTLFCSEKPKKTLHSEEEFRDFRYAFFRQIQERETIPCLLLAHHQEDQLETQMMALLRGAGEVGLRGMSEGSPQAGVFRPFLRQSREELERYARKKGLDYLEDPSNSEANYFRNWLRNHWFADLEKHRKGSLQALARSLGDISGLLNRERSTFEAQIFAEKSGASCIDLPSYLGLSSREQLRALALFLKKHQVHEFTRSQLVEIQKRLDSEQKEHSFKVGGHLWKIQSTEIHLESCL